MSNLKISVVVCTHNPNPSFFERCLDGLRTQTLTASSWELIIVDNASSPEQSPTPELQWHPNARLVKEPEIGLTKARLKGIAEVKTNLIVFVDDDNILDSRFLEVALETSEDYPFLGAWSGSCIPEFEVEPPEWTRRYWGCLAIKDVKRTTWGNDPRNSGCLPCGAGLCVRKTVADQFRKKVTNESSLLKLGRTGNSLLAGEDHVLAGSSCDLNMGFGVVTRLRLTHLMPSWRFTRDYIAKLMEGVYYSGVLLDGAYGVKPPRRNLLNKLADQIRVFRAGRNHRTVLAACYRGRNRAEIEVLKNSLS